MPTNTERFKEGLREKIDSLDKWKGLLTAAGYNTREWAVYPDAPRYMAWGDIAVGHMSAAAENMHEVFWWVQRETARQEYEIYPERTSVMTQLVTAFGLQQYCIHVSEDDPTLVAYTPSVEDGIRDKQVRLTFGKLFRKLLLLVTDTHLAALEAAHRSELDPTFLIATTPEEVVRVYTKMAGDSGCMRYAGSHWDLTGGQHPSMVYAYPGMGVAYTQDSTGSIRSRSVIWTNPDNPDDKRYVRVYGDPSLKRKLMRAGYRAGHLAGAKIAAVADKRRSRAGFYLMPYLDGPDGDQGSRDGMYGYIVKGEDCVRLITQLQYDRLVSMGYRSPYFKDHRTVSHQIAQVDPAKLNYTCALSGKEFNALDVESARLWVDGEIKTAATSEIATQRMTRVNTVDSSTASGAATVYVPRDADIKVFRDLWRIGGDWIDTPENREFVGCVLLSTQFGYAPGTWVHSSSTVDVSEDGTGQYLLLTDATQVYSETGAVKYVHSSQVDEMKRSKKYISTAPLGRVKLLTHVDNPNLHVTVGHRKVLSGVHDVVQMTDGRWDYTINTETRHIFGRSVRVPKGERDWSLRIDKDVLRRVVFDRIKRPTEVDYDRAVDRKTQLKELLRNTLRYGVNDVCFFMMGEALTQGSRYTNNPERMKFDALRAAAVKLGAMTDEQITEQIYAGIVPEARCWEHHAKLMFEMFDEAVAQWTAAEDPVAAPAVADAPRGWGSLDSTSVPTVGAVMATPAEINAALAELTV